MTRNRGSVSVLLILSFVLMAGMQYVTQRQHHELVRHASSAKPLSNLNSFSLALLLGGLRGPLVMFLWASSESQKNQRDLEDFDTKVELIRLLQPEFDSVHIFQVWNKAFNVSAQMASLANKYASILDAIDYAERINEERPNNLNLLYGLGQIYMDKLGNSNESLYYVRRVRAESKWRPPSGSNYAGSSARRVMLKAKLDPQGNLLPELVTPPANHRSSTRENGVAWNDGSQLQYLKQFEPFPYGVSPMALAYNYFKQCQVLQSAAKQKHLQLAAHIVDARPALALKIWAEEEWRQGRFAELKAFGRVVPSEIDQWEMPTASVALTDAPVDVAAIAEAIHGYERSVQVTEMSLIEYQEHLKHNPRNALQYQYHLEELQTFRLVSTADAAYLRAMVAPAGSEESRAARAQARRAYADAIHQISIKTLRYYVPDSVAQQIYPEGFNRGNIDQLPAAQIPMLMDRTSQWLSKLSVAEDSDRRDRNQAKVMIDRAARRLDQLSR